MELCVCGRNGEDEMNEKRDWVNSCWSLRARGRRSANWETMILKTTKKEEGNVVDAEYEEVKDKK